MLDGKKASMKTGCVVNASSKSLGLAAPFEQPGKRKNKKIFLIKKYIYLRPLRLENSNIHLSPPTNVCCLPSVWLALISGPRQPNIASYCQGPNARVLRGGTDYFGELNFYEEGS